MQLAKLSKTKFIFIYRSLASFSTLNPHSKITESQVLTQLSTLFPITIPQNKYSNTKKPETNSADDFLPPEEKLRGVFLQKLRGRSSIHRALDTVNVDLNINLFAKVVNCGNLSGDSMIAFFNWTVEKIGKDVFTYNVVIKALGRRKFFEHMMDLFGEMLGNGVRPDLETLSIVVDSFVCARRVSRGLRIFRELERYGFVLDEETLRVVLKCLCRRSHVGIACSLFSKVRRELGMRCDGDVYNVVIGGWAKIGRVSEVEKCLKDMVDDGVEVNSVTYGYVIECFGRAGRVGDAERVFEFLEEEKRSGLSTGVYNAMIFNCVSSGDVDGALRYYNGMMSNGIETDIDTYMRILLCFLKSKRVADAIEMFDEMLERGLVPSTGNVTELIEPLCRYGPPHAALMMYKKARKAGCKISLKAYKLLLMRLSRFGKCGMLLSIWDEMQESGYSSDMQVYDYIVNGLCNSGQLETAVMVMEESIQKGFFPGKIICSKLHNKLMDSNKVDVSYKLFLKIRGARVNENAQRYWRIKGWHF